MGSFPPIEITFTHAPLLGVSPPARPRGAEVFNVVTAVRPQLTREIYEGIE